MKSGAISNFVQIHTLKEDQDTRHKTYQSKTKATIFSRISLLKNLVMISLKGGGEMLDAKTKEQTDCHVQSYTDF